ncbi:hypothetical protein JOF28_000216 [Leucobacter exalbidus]|uniref:Uncharacterized protein n=1 Tax=Leucobacter exalbidus TaxID=662960 RepID=A0A940PTI8_9MICO|nr:hypothetical protein [Leucobacter exalbidus]MBP1324984.1 hypothetical protein [Leucobacter exalbidus]
MKTRPTLTVTAAASGLLLGLVGLTGCAAEPEAPSAKNTESVPVEETVVEETVAEEATVEETEREVPASCAALDLQPGATLDGAALGTCVSEALSSYGSGKMRVTADSSGDVEFTYNPTYEFQGTLEGSDGAVKISYVDGVIWIDQGTGPVKGDLESENLEEQLAGAAGELYRIYSDLEQTKQMIQAQPSWTVEEGQDLIELPSGEIVESFRITSDEAFSWHEMPFSEFILWFGEDWVPVGDQASIDIQGMQSTHTQHFYDLGVPVTITPLG